MPNALIRCVLIDPWSSTVLLLTTLIARTPVFKAAPGSTVTVTLVLPAAAETGVELVPSQMTVSLEFGVVLAQLASASRTPPIAASADARHSNETRPTARMSAPGVPCANLHERLGSTQVCSSGLRALQKISHGCDGNITSMLCIDQEWLSFRRNRKAAIWMDVPLL